jgi:hypothetical protein
MTMDKNRDLERFLEDTMAVDGMDISVPHPSLMYEARQKIAARKKPVVENRNIFLILLDFLKLELKFYHVGLSIMLIFAGVFYFNEPNYNTVNTSDLIYDHSSLSIKNTTISVNSSTMLTSIPTLVIRN